MSRDQLELVQGLAERQEKEAGERLSKAQMQVDSAQRQLAQVNDYRRDYYRLATGAKGDLLDTNQLQTARHFLSQLDSIVDRQQTTLAQSELFLEQQRISWIETRRRLNAIKNLRKSRSEARKRLDEKLEQRRLDELYANQQFFSKAL